MPSAKQLAANRRNAAKSTGPRTERGKARSRMNALRHGLAAVDGRKLLWEAAPSHSIAEVHNRLKAIDAVSRSLLIQLETAVASGSTEQVCLLLARLQATIRYKRAHAKLELKH